jgi:hypothetical protein
MSSAGQASGNSNPILRAWRGRVEQSRSEMLTQLEQVLLTDSDFDFELFRERMRAFRWNVIYLESLADLLMEENQ